jgi:MFS transporter, NNP family, nitrate/nitrite transporter
LNAGGGNLGVAAVQLVGLLLLVVASKDHLRLVLAIYVPLIVLAALGAALFMDNLAMARDDKRAIRTVIRPFLACYAGCVAVTYVVYLRSRRRLTTGA